MFGYWFFHIWASSKLERLQTSTLLLTGVGIVWAIIIVVSIFVSILLIAYAGTFIYAWIKVIKQRKKVKLEKENK